jgi:hypothetical protein
MAWRFVLDSGGVSLGELRASSRTLSVGVSAGATATAQIRADDPLWSATVAGDTFLRVYNSAGSLVFYGPVVSDEEQASGQGATVQINAADLSWRLGHRFTGEDKTGVGTTYTAQDSGDIAFAILAEANAAAATGITAGTKDTFVKRTITYLWQRSLDKLNELGAIQGSYEWRLRYTDGQPPVVNLDLLAALGSDRTSTVFLEYGTGKSNCNQYRRARSMDQQANRVWVLGSGSTNVTSAESSDSISRYGLLEDIVSYGDITDVALLDALAAAHIAIRRTPRTLVSLTPIPGKAPLYGVDWGIGDFVSARVKVRDVVRVAGFARVWAASIAIDELGNEQPTLTLEPQ